MNKVLALLKKLNTDIQSAKSNQELQKETLDSLERLLRIKI
jgi:hypothetical protein